MLKAHTAIKELSLKQHHDVFLVCFLLEKPQNKEWQHTWLWFFKKRMRKREQLEEI